MVKGPKGRAGLRGKDKKQDSLRDKRRGTYDLGGLPEGLTRKRKGPLSKTRGRKEDNNTA